MNEIMPIKKYARSRAKDPAQEKIRAQKDLWNKACSEFINRLIAFKRGVNGRGDARYNIPPSKITSPLPSEVGSMLNELASNFSHLVDGANTIFDSQMQYASSRGLQQKHVKNQLKASSQYQLVSESSNKLTRFLAHIKGRFSRGPFSTERLSMLTLSSNILKDCLDFQDAIATQGRKPIENANTIFHKIELQLKALSAYSHSIIKIIESKNPKSVEEEEDNINEFSKANNIINDLVFAIKLPYLNNGPNNEAESNKILNIIRKFEREKEGDESKKEFYFVQFEMLYKYFLRDYLSIFISFLNDRNIKHNLNKNSSFKDIYEIYSNIEESFNRLVQEQEQEQIQEQEIKKESYTNYDITKNAHNRFSRWIKNKLNKLNSSASSSFRINIFEQTEEFKNILNDLMNMLEKDISKDLLEDLIQKLNNQIKKIEELFLTLEQMVTAEDLKDPDTAKNLQNLIKRKKLKQLTLGF